MSKSKSKEVEKETSGKDGAIVAKATYIEVPKESGTGEKFGDISSMLKTHRTSNGKRTESELFKLDKLRRVYEGVFGGGSCPSEFKVEEKQFFDANSVTGAIANKITGGLFDSHSGFKPDQEYYFTTNWYRTIDAKNGKYKPEAKAMVNIICTFQAHKAKREGVTYAGYPDDPENLFLEEVKKWICDYFARFREEDRAEILQRCSYLEDILCKEGLFDRPDSDDKFTLQKVVVAIRRILKATVSLIDAALTHVDAGRSLEQIMDSLRLFMDEAASLLWYSFRENSQLEGEAYDNTDFSTRLHLAVLSSPQLKQVLPHRSKYGSFPAPKVIGFGPNGKPELNQAMLPESLGGSGTTAIVSSSSAPKFVELSSEDQLSKIFSDDNSGFDKNFRGNYIVANLYLEAYAFLMDLGALFGVLKQAKGAAQTGGTLLLYGAANAHFNALLELTERLTDGMRTRCAKIVDIGEARFEQLIEINWATTTRCKWIANYRELPRILVQIEKNASEVFRTVGKARSEANALTLKERKEQAEEETTNFLTAAEGLTKTAGRSLNISFNSYKALETSEKQTESVNQMAKQMKNRDAEEKKKAEEEAKRKEEEYLAKQLTKAAENTSARVYQIDITTSRKPLSGTDSAVYVTLVGDKGKTCPIHLPDDGPLFETGRTDRFILDVQGEIGQLTALTVKLTPNEKQKEIDTWRLNKIQVLDKSGPKTYVFEVKDEELGDGMFQKSEKTFPAKRV